VSQDTRALIEEAKRAVEGPFVYGGASHEVCRSKLAALYGLVPRLVAALEAAEANASGCPCLFMEPCHPLCSCRIPLQSAGCARCCRYGSEEQQRSMARHLALLPVKLAAAERVVEAARKWVAAQNRMEDVRPGFSGAELLRVETAHEATANALDAHDDAREGK